MTVTAQMKAERFIATLRHCQILGLTVVSASEGELCLRLPYSPKIIGNPLSGVVHGGPLTTMMDTACGTAVFTALPDFELCPTLDLRVDYMKASNAGEDLLAHATVVSVSKNVVFTECLVTQESDGQRVAKCNATFMRIGADMTPPEFEQVIKTGDVSLLKVRS